MPYFKGCRGLFLANDPVSLIYPDISEPLATQLGSSCAAASLDKAMKIVIKEVNDNFPHGFHEALGRFAVAFGRVEYVIKLAVKSLSGKEFNEGIKEAASYGQFRNLCKKAKELADEKLAMPEASTFSILIDKALNLATDRNANLHALWTADEKGTPFRYGYLSDAKGKRLDWHSRPVTIAELNNLTDALSKLYRDIDAARRKSRWCSNPW